jgi:hypothetical protein
LRWSGSLKGIRNNTVPKFIMKWNVEERREKGKAREQWIDEVRRSKINKDLTEKI